MHFLHLTLLYCMLNIFSGDAALEHPASSPATVLKSCAANPATTHAVKPAAINIIFQSTDGGQTWYDISYGLPENEHPEAFFAGASEVYVRVKDVMYRSKTDLKTPVWERETLDPRCTSIAFTRSGVMAYSHEGNLYQKMPATGTWLPVYANFKEQAVRTIFETSDGTVFFGCDNGLYKSADRGRSWKQVYHEGWVMDLAEADGVLVATGQHGIMRSTDNGERWEWVINEGGGGIAVERIDGGFAAISASSSSFSRRVRISFDRGKTWNAIDAGLQPSLNISSIKQIGRYLICGHPEGIFRSSDMGKTWNNVHPRVDDTFTIDGKTWDRVPSIDSGKVFQIYVSGNVLYAVARNSGC